MLKAYFWIPDKDEDSGVAVIAETVKEAKLLGWVYWGIAIGNDSEFTDCRCTLLKNRPDIEGLKRGVVEDYKDGMVRGLYFWIEDECELCHSEGRLAQVYQGKVICDDCDEKTNGDKQC